MANEESAPGESDSSDVSDEAAGDNPAGGSTSNDEGVSDLSYEVAREELIDIVARIESGTVPLEESMMLWERGESLAAHCQSKLDVAQAQLDSATPAKDDA